MVNGVAGGSVDDGVVGDKFTVVDHDGPDVDEGEQTNVCELVEGENEWENVVWHTLRVAVKRVECVGCEWSWHNPLVVWLVEVLVDQRVVKSTVDKVDEEVGEEQEQRDLQKVVPATECPPSILRERVVHKRVALHLSEEKGNGEEGHDRHSLHCLPDLHPDLVLEKSRVVESGLVEHEKVGSRSHGKV